MTTITFQGGQSVNFNGTPTPQDIDEVAQKIGIQPSQGLGGAIMDNFNPVKNVSQAFTGGVNQAKSGFSGAVADLGAFNPVKAIEDTTSGIAGAVGAITSPLAAIYSPIVNPIVSGLTTAASPLTDIPAVQNFANSDVGQGIARGINDVSNVNTIAGAAAGGEKIASHFSPEAIATRQVAAQAQAAADASEATIRNQGIIQTAIRDTANKYGTSRNILHNMETRNGTNPLGVISSYGPKAIPEIVADRGVVNPLPAIDFLNSRISELGDLKSGAVELSNKPTSLSDIQTKINNIIGQQGWTKLQSDRALAKIGNIESIDPVTGEVIPAKGELGSIQASYPDGNIPLKEIDQLKTYEGKLSNSYNNKSAGPFELDAHGVLAKAYRGIVEDNTDDQTIRDFNKYIQSHYDAIELLKSLENKTPHGGMLTKQIQKIAAEGAGGLIGTTIAGPLGTIIGGAAGGALSDTVMGIFNDNFISNPLKAMLIKNMTDVPDPIIQKMLNYIDQKKSSNFAAAAQLGLPAPAEGAPRSSIGSNGTIPVMGGGSTMEMPNQPIVAGSYTPSKLPPLTPAPPVFPEYDSSYTPPEKLPIINMGTVPKEVSNLPIVNGSPKVYSKPSEYEPYTPSHKLPIIDMGKVPKKTLNLPTAKGAPKVYQR